MAQKDVVIRSIYIGSLYLPLFCSGNEWFCVIFQGIYVVSVEQKGRRKSHCIILAFVREASSLFIRNGVYICVYINIGVYIGVYKSTRSLLALPWLYYFVAFFFSTAVWCSGWNTARKSEWLYMYLPICFSMLSCVVILNTTSSVLLSYFCTCSH